MSCRLTKATEIDVFTPEQCEEVINAAAAVGFREGVTYVRGSDTPIKDPKTRIANTANLGPRKHKWIYDAVKEKVLEANKYYDYDLDGKVSLYVLHYPVGGHISMHNDASSPAAEKRKLTVSIQLSLGGAYTGGELVLIGGSSEETGEVTREQGKGVVFPSLRFHRLLPVTGGDRYALIGWFEGARSFR